MHSRDDGPKKDNNPEELNGYGQLYSLEILMGRQLNARVVHELERFQTEALIASELCQDAAKSSPMRGVRAVASNFLSRGAHDQSWCAIRGCLTDARNSLADAAGLAAPAIEADKYMPHTQEMIMLSGAVIAQNKKERIYELLDTRETFFHTRMDRYDSIMAASSQAFGAVRNAIFEAGAMPQDKQESLWMAFNATCAASASLRTAYTDLLCDYVLMADSKGDLPEEADLIDQALVRQLESWPSGARTFVKEITEAYLDFGNEVCRRTSGAEQDVLAHNCAVMENTAVAIQTNANWYKEVATDDDRFRVEVATGEYYARYLHTLKSSALHNLARDSFIIVAEALPRIADFATPAVNEVKAYYERASRLRPVF